MEYAGYMNGEWAMTPEGIEIAPVPGRGTARNPGIARCELLRSFQDAALRLGKRPTGAEPYTAAEITQIAVHRVRFADDLDDLCRRMIAVHLSMIDTYGGTNYARLRQDFGLILSRLPAFGGRKPRNLRRVHSWDAGRVLVYDNGWWHVEEREDVPNGFPMPAIPAYEGIPADVWD